MRVTVSNPKDLFKMIASAAEEEDSLENREAWKHKMAISYIEKIDDLIWLTPVPNRPKPIVQAGQHRVKTFLK